MCEFASYGRADFKIQFNPFTMSGQHPTGLLGVAYEATTPGPLFTERMDVLP